MAHVLIMAGGTGGHVFPALAVARELRRRGWQVSWMGAPESFEAHTVPAAGFPLVTVAAHRLRGQGVGGLVLTPFRLTRAVIQAWRQLGRLRPQVVLGMGGFVTAPGGLASRLRGIPLVIHEQNTVPGMANRWLARFASRVLEAFPGSFPPATRAIATGNPVRAELLQLPEPEARFADRHGPIRLLVLGGSLGAQALNEQVPAALAEAALGLEVRHQAGRGKAQATKAAYREVGVEAEVTEFVEQMAKAYAWADLVVCRAGALTVSELAAVGLGAVLVPYPHAVDDHQTRNAGYLVEAGAARLLPQQELTSASLAGLLRELCADRATLLEMSRRARALGRPDATREVAEQCMEVAA